MKVGWAQWAETIRGETQVISLSELYTTVPSSMLASVGEILSNFRKLFTLYLLVVFGILFAVTVMFQDPPSPPLDNFLEDFGEPYLCMYLSKWTVEK
jgi:hypothetical protein